MSAVTVPATVLPEIAPVPFKRLVAVESRKMTDTRAGLWLMAITGGLVTLVFLLMLIIGSVNGAYIGADTWLQYLPVPVSLLVPVLAMTSVTQEWGQRTAMVTFALEPSRLRVALAKLTVVFGLAVATIALALVLGVLGNVINAAWVGHDLVWGIKGAALAWAIVTEALNLLMGFGLALLLLNTPAVVVIYYVYTFVLQSILSTLFVAFDWARSVLPWIDMGLAILPFNSSANQAASMQAAGIDLVDGPLGVARLVTSIGLWVVLPLVLGTWRLLRAEVK